MKRGNKRGELTTKQIVTLIVLIASFIIILFLLFRLDLGETTNKEICHNSVLLQERSVFSGPLDCRTNYLCIGDNCEDFEEDVKVGVDDKELNETFEVLANEISDCWWQFGEGEIDYVGDSSFGKVSCSICSIVDFDEGLEENSASYISFYDYLSSNSHSNFQTYLQYIYSTNDIEDISGAFGPNLDDYFQKSFDFSKRYFILTGRSEKGYANTPFWSWNEGSFSDSYPVVILEVSEENYDKIGCDNFLTKA